MNTLFGAAVDIQALCATQGWKCCVIEGVIVRQGPQLDRHQVLAELRPLLDLKEDREAEPRLLELLSKHPIT